MKIPKYIERALSRRRNAALDLMNADHIITKFIQKYDIEVDPADYCTGVEMYTNPTDSALRIREAIIDHDKN